MAPATRVLGPVHSRCFAAPAAAAARHAASAVRVAARGGGGGAAAGMGGVAGTSGDALTSGYIIGVEQLRGRSGQKGWCTETAYDDDGPELR
jgi:hypothetical protein